MILLRDNQLKYHLFILDDVLDFAKLLFWEDLTVIILTATNIILDE